MSMVDLANGVADLAHGGQTDKAGQPYRTHPKRVAAYVKADGYGDEYQAVAWLHDVVEDTPVSLGWLGRLGFTDTVLEAVDAITMREGETREDYYQRVKANPIALVVKLADVRDNSDPERLALLPDDAAARLTAKYANARKVLTE